MIDVAIGPNVNMLLEALPHSQWARWKPRLESVDLALGQVLHESGATLQYVYFPINAIVSLLYEMSNGVSAEVAIVGREGLVGISAFMGGDSMPGRAVVQCAGRGARLDARIVKDDFGTSDSVMHLLLRFTQALMAQVAQTVVCTRHHSLDQQLCRWLLLSLDRIDGNELVLTQDLIAKMIGVRREGVTEAAAKLQNLDLIRYSRGHIVVLDRAGLERRSCECYAVVQKEYDRLLRERIDATARS